MPAGHHHFQVGRGEPPTKQNMFKEGYILFDIHPFMEKHKICFGGNSTGPLIKYIVCSPGGGSAPTQQSPTVAAEEAIANLSAPAAAA